MSNKSCDWTTALFNDGKDNYDKNAWDKYKNKVLDNNGNLKLDYDVAYKESKGMFRMPTKDEVKELVNNTDSEWCEINGVKGIKFISKKDDSKWIFIPAAGFRSEYSLDDQGSYCCLWSSTLCESSPRITWFLDFYSSNAYVNYNYRYFGFSVRDVKVL